MAETFPTDATGSFIPPGRAQVISATESTRWSASDSTGISEWVDTFDPTDQRTITEVTNKGGVPTGSVDRVVTDHVEDITATYPYRHSGLAQNSLASMFGSLSSGATDTVSTLSPGLYQHILALGVTSARTQTQHAWKATGGYSASDTLEFRALTCKTFQLMWANALLSVSAGYESLHRLTSEDALWTAPPSGVNLVYIGGSGGPTKMVTRGLETTYAIREGNASEYGTIFTGGDITLGRTIKRVYGKSGGSYLTPGVQAAPTGVTATVGAGGSLSQPTTYDYYISFADASGNMTPLSNVSSATTTSSNKKITVDWSASTLPAGLTNVLVFRVTHSQPSSISNLIADVAITGGTPTTLVDDGTLALGPIYNANMLNDPISPADLESGFLTVSGTLHHLFDGSHTGTPYRDFMDFNKLGKSGAANRIKWVDRLGHTLELDFWPIRLDTNVVSETPEGLDATSTFTAEYDMASAASATPSLPIVTATLINDVAGSLIY